MNIKPAVLGGAVAYRGGSARVQGPPKNCTVHALL